MIDKSVLKLGVKLRGCMLGVAACSLMRCPPPPGRKTAMKFDVEKIFQETRRTAREYSQQTSGGRRSIVPLSTSRGVGGATHFIHSF